eukprot:753491-Hanusia_phi.AAC.2
MSTWSSRSSLRTMRLDALERAAERTSPCPQDLLKDLNRKSDSYARRESRYREEIESLKRELENRVADRHKMYRVLEDQTGGESIVRQFLCFWSPGLLMPVVASGGPLVPKDPGGDRRSESHLSGISPGCSETRERSSDPKSREGKKSNANDRDHVGQVAIKKENARLKEEIEKMPGCSCVSLCSP